MLLGLAVAYDGMKRGSLYLPLSLSLIAGSASSWSVAPMMKHTTAFHRAFMRILAPSSVLFTEMFTAEELLLLSDEALRFELPCASGQVLQLGGRDPDLLSKAVR